MTNRNLIVPMIGAVVVSLGVSSSPAQTVAITPGTPSEAYSQPEAAAATTVTSPAAPASATLPPHTAQYTIAKGDTLTKISVKFNSSRKQLETLNNLTNEKVAVGQVILIPWYKKTKPGEIAAIDAKKKQHAYPIAQPVQGFDMATTPAVALRPMPVQQDESTTPTVSEKPAPVAKLVSPADLQAELAKLKVDKVENARLAAAHHPIMGPPNTAIAEAPSGLKYSSASKHGATSVPALTAHPSSSLVNSSTARTMNRNLALNQTPSPAANDWGTRFIQQARALGNEGIEYDESWRPPGEARGWEMDCSNTSRYLYKVTTGITLPRTASDQYYYLHLQGKAWDVPQNSQGWADGAYLRENLKPGDLLFWENTYRPERQPPITHVMVFLGTNAQGQWIMAGSQSSRGGEHNRRNGGPDIYIFRPSQPCGGYTTWLGMVHHTGRFCAFGRPLEADRSKLAVAAND